METIKKDILPTHLSMVQLALRWLLDHDAVSAIIPGASSPKHIAFNAEASALEALSPEVHEALIDLYKAQIHKEIRGGY